MKLRKCLALLVVCCCLLGSAGAQQSADALSQREAIYLLRRLNTIQIHLLAKEGAYAPLAEITRTLNDNDVVMNGADTAAVKDYTLTIVLSADGRSYRAALHPTTQCGEAYFTDNGGVIYLGRALGCP